MWTAQLHEVVSGGTRLQKGRTGRFEPFLSVGEQQARGKRGRTRAWAPTADAIETTGAPAD
jgi:hypothetical protein